MKQTKKVIAILLAIATVLTLFVAPVSAASYRTNANGAGASSSYQNGKYYKYLQNITLTGDKRTDVIAVALSQLGYQESASSSNISGESGGSGNYTEFMKHVYGSNEAWAWCAAFCAWSLHQSQSTDHVGYNKFYRNHTGESGYHWCEISCPYWKQALQFDGLYKNSAYNGGSYTPKTGDLIFFKSSGATVVGHIGLVVYTDGSYVYTVEGNTSSGTGLEANGGGVYFKKYALSSSNIDGYGALDYPSTSDGNDIDYSGANPTTGLYMTAAYKYLYADESCTTRATYTNGVNVDVPRYTMVEVIGVSADKTALKVTYDGVTGYLHNNSTDRVIQLTSTSGGNGGNTGGETPGGNQGGTTTGGIHQLQGVGIPSSIIYKHGIDISYYQVGGSNLAYNMIDFAKLKAAGCEFVILRAGDSALSGYIDPSFIQLYKNAKAAGMDVGVYYFSRATTYAGSQAEAEWLIGVMKENNMQFEYPVYIDIETSAQGSLSASAADQLCLGWCETLEKAGYFPGIYSGTYVMFDKISSAVTDYYDLWIASYATVDSAGPHWDYNTKDMASKGYAMWQYSCFNLNSSNNYVYSQGIYTDTTQTTPVRDLDLDVCYKDYPTIMKTYGYNGFGATETRPESIVAGKDYTTTGTAGDPYYANLTDGVVGGVTDTLEGWCGWNSDGTVTFDLGENHNISGVALHLMNKAEYGIGTAVINISVSDDGVNYTTYSKTVPVNSNDGAYWAELDIDGIFDGRYVKISFARDNGSWIFMNEIEVYGEKRNTSNLALGGSYTTSSNGDKHSTALWQDDEIRLTDGTKNYVDIGGEAYAGWQATSVDIIVDLGRVKTTGTYVVYTGSGNWGITAMKDVKVSVSTDGKTYTAVDTPSVYEVTGTGNDSVELAKLTVSSAKAYDARYVKFTLEGTGSFVWFDEVEVYAKTSGGEICKDNLVSDKDYTIITGDGQPSGDRYTANLTDGVALSYKDIYTNGAWFGFTDSNTNGNYGAVVFDLGATYDISGARLYLMNDSSVAVKAPESVYISVSDDGEKYTVYPVQFAVKSEDGSYWTELTTDGIFAGRYVRVSMERTSSWAFINEIEVYGSLRNDGGNLALGGNYTTSTDGVMHDNTKYQDDGDRLTDGSKSDGKGATDSYSGWIADNVEVVVDLGSVKSTGTYVVYSASNFWGINSPENVVVYVSTDGKTFNKVYAPVNSELVGTGSITDAGATVEVKLMKHTVSAAELVNARYVKFAIEADGLFVWIDEVEVFSEVSGSEATYENLLSGLTHTSTTGTLTGALTNTGNLTDGAALPYNEGVWFGIRSSSLDATNANTVNDSADLIYDLGDVYDISNARIHLMNLTGNGICTPKSLKLWVSVDGVTYSNYATFTTDSTNGICYWATVDNVDGLIGRYVKITVDMNADKSNGGGGWVMLNEIEVYGEKTEIPSGTINSVTYVVDGDNVVFTITTSPDYNRVKVTTVDDLSGYIKYTSESTVDAQGNTVYTLTVPAVVGTTKYAFDGRFSSTGIYENDYYYVDVTIEAPTEPEELFKSVSYEIKDDKIVFTVVTAAGDYNRVKVTTPNKLGGSLGVGTYTVNENGDYVWTVKAAAPTESMTYAFDIRSSATGKYLKEYYTFNVEIVDVEIFKSVSYEIKDDKIIFTVVTAAGDYNRVKVTTPDNLGGSLGVGTYTVNENGDYVWTVKAAAPTESMTYAFDIRSSATGKYLKEYYTFNVEIVDVEIFKSVSYEIKDDKIIFTVVTAAGDYNRVKVTTPDNLSGSLGVGTYTVNENGDYVWTVKAAAPTESMTYAFDIRSSVTGKYLKDYYIVDVTVEAEEVIIKSATHEIKGDKIYFTVVTAAGNYERIKATTADKLGGSLGVGATYTVDENGDYVWVFKVAAPTESTTYAFDLRSSETGKYLKDYFIYDVAI